MADLDIVSTNEIAAMLGVKPGTVHTWRSRGQFPPPEAQVSGTPVWRRATVVAWAAEGGRDVAELMTGSYEKDRKAGQRARLMTLSQQAANAIGGLPRALQAAQAYPSTGWVQSDEANAEALRRLAAVVDELVEERVRDLAPE